MWVVLGDLRNPRLSEFDFGALAERAIESHQRLCVTRGNPPRCWPAWNAAWSRSARASYSIFATDAGKELARAKGSTRRGMERRGRSAGPVSDSLEEFAQGSTRFVFRFPAKR
jgi:hypothetical protein